MTDWRRKVNNLVGMCSWGERLKWLPLQSKTKHMNTECDHVLMSPVIVEALRSEWACL